MIYKYRPQKATAGHCMPFKLLVISHSLRTITNHIAYQITTGHTESGLWQTLYKSDNAWKMSCSFGIYRWAKDYSMEVISHRSGCIPVSLELWWLTKVWEVRGWKIRQLVTNLNVHNQGLPWGNLCARLSVIQGIVGWFFKAQMWNKRWHLQIIILTL